jgi:phenylpropionate dioxygenase-like ring-hydroxylating dioxygenase large terminal subunit
MCIYHGWIYNNDGSLARVPGDDAYTDNFDKSSFGLRRPARFEEYRGFWFMNLDADAPALTDYLAGAKDYIDLVIDQSPSGQMEIIAGVQEYDVAANWKLMVENSVDDYHLPSTHSTWLNFMANSGVKLEPPPKDAGLVLPTKGYAIELGNGHFTTDNVNFRGRPVAKWIPLYGEPAKAEIDDIRKELVTRLGPERAARVADTNRNLVIFPNLVINDGSSVTVRTFYPQGADKMHVTAWALGPVEEGESARARRLDAFLTFYGPGGFATPDDVEALELVQQGLANWHEDRWSEMSRGMGKESEQLNSDEHHLRIFWRRWNELMGAPA